jgi:ribosomal protein L17
VLVSAIVKYVMNTIDTVAHTLEFNFDTVTNTQAIDALVFALSIDLLVHNRIECTQPCANQLEFTSDAHCTFAQLVLCSDSRYSVTRLSRIVE